jgi:hypothetical protein
MVWIAGYCVRSIRHTPELPPSALAAGFNTSCVETPTAHVDHNSMVGHGGRVKQTLRIVHTKEPGKSNVETQASRPARGRQDSSQVSTGYLR